MSVSLPVCIQLLWDVSPHPHGLSRWAKGYDTPQTSRPLPAVMYDSDRNPLKGPKAQTDGLNDAWFSKFPVSRKPNCRFCANTPTPIESSPKMRSLIERKRRRSSIETSQTKISRRLIKLKPGKASGNNDVSPRYICKLSLYCQSVRRFCIAQS